MCYAYTHTCTLTDKNRSSSLLLRAKVPHEIPTYSFDPLAPVDGYPCKIPPWAFWVFRLASRKKGCSWKVTGAIAAKTTGGIISWADSTVLHKKKKCRLEDWKLRKKKSFFASFIRALRMKSSIFFFIIVFNIYVLKVRVHVKSMQSSKRENNNNVIFKNALLLFFFLAQQFHFWPRIKISDKKKIRFDKSVINFSINNTVESQTAR